MFDNDSHKEENELKYISETICNNIIYYYYHLYFFYINLYFF